MLRDSDFKDQASLAKFAKDYWQIREEIAYMYKLKRKTDDKKEQLDLDKTIEVLRMMLIKNYYWDLTQPFEIRDAIDIERKHRYEGHRNKSKPWSGWDVHQPHK